MKVPDKAALKLPGNKRKNHCASYDTALVSCLFRCVSILAELYWDCIKRKSSLYEQSISGQLAFHQIKSANKSPYLNLSTLLNFYRLSPLSRRQRWRTSCSIISDGSRCTMTSHESMMVPGLKCDLIAGQFASGSLSQSVGQSDKAERRMESEVCPRQTPRLVPWLVICWADVIDMAETPNGIMAAAVISWAKWAHVGRVGPRWSALDQKDSFQQTALHGN